MSHLNLDRKAIRKDENATSNSNEQENSNTTINMDLVEKEETAKQGENMITENKNFRCIDIENSIEPPADKNDDMRMDIGSLVNVTDFKTVVINPNAGKRKVTVMGMYHNIFSPGQQQQQPPQYVPMYTRQLWRQEPPPAQPQQTMWTQYVSGPNPNQGLSGYGGHDGYGDGGPLIYDPRSRNSFVALVMGIVFVMLLSTAAFLITVLLIPEVRQFFRGAGWVIALPAFMGLIVVNCTMMLSPCGRRPPCNVIMLILTTVFMSIIAAKVTSHYRTEVILYAVLVTGAVVFVCMCLACSKFDFTSWMLYVIVIATAFSVIVIIILLVMMINGSMMKPLVIAILVIGTLIQILMEVSNTKRDSIAEIVSNYQSAHID